VHTFLLFGAAFLASAVEMVEALTIVLAVGMTRGWRAAGWGVAAALVALAAIIAGLGPAIASVPIDSLRLVVGTLLLLFGLQWLRKAVLRAGGVKAKHDEDEIFAAEVRDLERASGRGSHDWYGFTVAFKGVFLEGLEVAFIVVTFGGAQHDLGIATIGAATALLAVVLAGIAVHAPLSRVPENALKFGVGVMLCAFGIFWSGEGAGVAWPGGDVFLLALVVSTAVLSLLVASWIRRATSTPVVAA
jgi:uncharacterized membrane protein